MLHCDTYGDEKKSTILLLHGAGVVDTFRGQYPLAEQYHLVVPHLYGAGEAADRVYDTEALTDELLELVDSLGKEQIGLMGHSLGAQLAVMLVCRRPERFAFAVFLSAWVDPQPGMVKAYCAMAGAAARMLHIRPLVRLQGKYWHFSQEQTAYLVAYSQKITPDVYRSFFANTLDLRRLPAYASVRIPMLAVCGSGEIRDMKRSLKLLGENPCCKTLVLPKAGHDFPMRREQTLNELLMDFLEQRD